MRKIIFIACSIVLFSSCLKQDVLKQDAVGNFRETDFFRSGDFGNLKVSFTDTIITTIQTSGGALRCRPSFVIQLDENYRKSLSESWDGPYKLILERPLNPNNDLEVFESTNFDQKYQVTSMPAVQCGNGIAFSLTLQLITPTTSVIASAEEDYIMPTIP